MDDIDNILNGEEPQVAEVVEEPQAEAPEEPKQPRGPDGKFASKGEDTDAPPASEDRVPIAAIHDERRKRQELERRVAEYEAKLQQLQNPPQPAPDMFENPEGWQNHFGGQIKQQAAQEASFNSLLNTSEMLCRDKYEDFEEAKTKFMELAEANPVLAQQALGDPHPWRKAYTLVKNHEKMEALGATDAQSLEARLRGTSGVWNPPTIDEILGN
jgi:DNA repair exonuclease SbcCD ATPase subunit